MLALLALARFVLREAATYFVKEDSFGDDFGTLQWRSFCPFIYLDVREYQHVRVATKADLRPRLSASLLFGSLRRLQLTAIGLKSLPLALYVLWSLVELDARGNPIVVDAMMCKTLKTWRSRCWRPRILLDATSPGTDLYQDYVHVHSRCQIACSCTVCEVDPEVDPADRLFDLFPTVWCCSDSAPWLDTCFNVRTSGLRVIHELEVDDISDAEYLGRDITIAEGGTSSSSSAQSEKPSSISSESAIIYPKCDVQFSRVQALQAQGEMRSLGTLDHSAGPGNCFVCRKYVQGRCEAGYACPRCHGPHDASSVPRGGGSTRQRAARQKGSLMRTRTPDPFE